jgi:hypothetical protein
MIFRETNLLWQKTEIKMNENTAIYFAHAHCSSKFIMNQTYTVTKDLEMDM